MSKINELFNRIDELNKKIEELEEEKRHAGFHSDPATVQQCLSKIKILEAEKSTDYVLKYGLDIKSCKKEIVDIIVDYYKKGNTIEDIIRIENISSEISNKWLSLSNFGEETGFLFVDPIEDEKYNWKYSNPISEIQLYSFTIDELKSKINDNDEVYLIFDDNLANDSLNKDLNIYKKIINNRLDELKDFNPLTASNIFNYLRIYAGKFNKDQISYLCKIMVNNALLNDYASDFNHIMDVNRDKLDEKLYNETYEKIIDKILWRFRSFGNMQDIFAELSNYCDKMNEKQANLLLDSIIKNDDAFHYCDDFEHVINVAENKFDNVNFNGFYKNIINDKIGLLKDIDFENSDDSIEIFHDLSKFANHFDEKQFFNLYDEIVNNLNITGFADDFRDIVEVNENKFEEINRDKIYQGIIENRIKALKESDLQSRSLLNDLTGFADYFTEDQFRELYEIIEDKNLVKYFTEVALNPFLRQKNIFDDEMLSNMYGLLIDYHLNELANLTFGFSDAKSILGSLAGYASVFTEKQVNRLCEISIENSQVYKCFICTDNLKHILERNKGKCNKLLLDKACKKNDIVIY